MNIRARGFVTFYESCITNCHYNFNPCGIFEKKYTVSGIGWVFVCFS